MADEDTGGAGQQDPPAVTQQAADPPVVADATTPGEKAELIAGRDKAKERARVAEARAAELQKQVEAATGKAVSDEDRALLAKVKADADQKTLDKALKEGDADKIAEQARAPLEQQVDQLRQKLENRETQLTRKSRDEALLKAAADAGAANPSQVVGLLRDRVTMKENPLTHEFEPSFVGASGEPVYAADGAAVTVDSFVKAYLTEPGNANLVKSSAVPGSGAKPAGGATTGTEIPTTLEEYNAIPEDRRLEVYATLTVEQKRLLWPSSKPEHVPGSLIS